MRKYIEIVWITTFIVVLPLLAQRWVFSPLFYASNRFRGKAASLVDELNSVRYLDAAAYLQSLDIEYNKQLHERQVLGKVVSNEFTVVVITKKRFVCAENEFDCEPHYLQQTIAALDRESKRQSVDNNFSKIVPIVVCSVDSQWETHQDLLAVMKYFPIIFRYRHTSDKKPSNKAQETSDYAFCLEETSVKYGRTTKYLLVVEDDAIVFENFFITLSSILKNRIESNISKGETTYNERRWCWMKLYYPEFWCGFGWDWNLLWELFWIATVGGMIGSILAFVSQTLQRKKVSVFLWACHGALYLLLLAIVISRQTWLEMRRIHFSLMQVTSNSGCCSTVAVLYPMDEIAKIVNYLSSSICKRCNEGVDLAIRDYKDKFQMLGLLVQPNLARHIGMHSTVSQDYKDPIHMLFYDMLTSS